MGLSFPFLAFWWLRRKKGRRACALGLPAYAVAYLLLSMLGRPMLLNHGGSDWRAEWCPLLCVQAPRRYGYTKGQLTPVGLFFWPGLAVDRLLWHKTDDDPLIPTSRSDAM